MKEIIDFKLLEIMKWKMIEMNTGLSFNVKTSDKNI